MKIAMDTAKSQTVDLVQMMEMTNEINTDAKVTELSVNPHLGGTIDIKL